MIKARRRRGFFPFPPQGEVFHPWLRRRFPVLEAAEGNALFQAFRQRRKEHHVGFGERLTGGKRMSVTPAYVIICAAVTLVTIIGFLIAGCFALVIPAIAIPLIQSRYSRRANTLHYLPRRLSDVFSERGYFQAAAVDIYMTGHSGHEVAEAIYLEVFERTMKTSTVAWFIMGIVPLSFYIYFVYPEPALAPAITAFTALLFYVSLFFMGIDLQAGSIAKVKLKKLYAFWGGKVAEAAVVEVGRSIIVIVMLFLFIIGAVFYFLSVIHLAEMQFSSAPAGSLGHYLFRTIGYWATSLFFLLLTVLALAPRSLFVARARTVERDLELALVPYQQFMQNVVLQDPVQAPVQAAGHYPPSPGPLPPPPLPPPQEQKRP